MTDIVRESVLTNQVSASVAGTLQRGQILTIQGIGLEEFDELFVHWLSTVSIVGTAPTIRLILQRAVRPNPDPTVDVHWDDYAAFFSSTGPADRILYLPMESTGVSTGLAGTKEQARVSGSALASQVLAGHWGDRLRVLEIVGGTITTPMTYSVYMTGINRG